MVKRIFRLKGVLISLVLFLFSLFLLPLFSFSCGPEICLRLFPNKVSLAEVLFGQLQENFGLLQGYEYHNHPLVFKLQDILSILIFDLLICFIIGIAIAVKVSSTGKRKNVSTRH